MAQVQLGSLTEIGLGAKSRDVTRGQRLCGDTALQYSLSACHRQTFYTQLNIFLQGRINGCVSSLVPNLKIASLFSKLTRDGGACAS